MGLVQIVQGTNNPKSKSVPQKNSKHKVSLEQKFLSSFFVIFRHISICTPEKYQVHNQVSQNRTSRCLALHIKSTRIFPRIQRRFYPIY